MTHDIDSWMREMGARLSQDAAKAVQGMSDGIGADGGMIVADEMPDDETDLSRLCRSLVLASAELRDTPLLVPAAVRKCYADAVALVLRSLSQSE